MGFEEIFCSGSATTSTRDPPEWYDIRRRPRDTPPPTRQRSLVVTPCRTIRYELFDPNRFS